MKIAKRNKRHTQRRRQLRLEPLEERRLLANDLGWAFALEGAYFFPEECLVDQTGNTIIAGNIASGTIDFDPGPGVTEISADVRSGFVAKYASDSSLIWLKEITSHAGPDADANPFSLNGGALDGDGNIYLVGTFEESATFGDTTLHSQGGDDMFVSKLDADGNFIWTAVAGAAADDRGLGVEVSGDGHIYVAGYFRDTVSFDGHSVTSNGDWDGYVAQLDSTGTFQWAVSMGGAAADQARHLAIAPNGSLYVSGYILGPADIGGHQLENAGGLDGFIASLDNESGAVSWAQRVGGSSDDRVYEIAACADNSVVATGYVGSVVNLGPFQIGSTDSRVAFVMRMNADGTFRWASATEKTDGVQTQAGGLDLALDAEENIYVTGSSNYTTDFDPGPAVVLDVTVNSDPVYQESAFIWKLDAEGDFVTLKHSGGKGWSKNIAIGLDGDVYWTGIMNEDTVYLPNGAVTRSPADRGGFFAKLPAYMFERHDVLFSDSFENGQWNGKFVQDSQNDWFTSTQRATLGSYSAEVDGRATDATLTVAQPIDLTAYGSAELTFDWYIENTLDSGEYLAVDLFNGSTWSEAMRLEGNLDAEDVWHQPYVQIPQEYLVSNFQFRFRAKMNRSDEDANVDNVQLVGTSLAGEPNNAPVAVADSATTNEDTGVTVNVLANDSDSDGDAIAVGSVTQAANGSVVDKGDGTVTYTPNQNFSGTDSFTYRAYDGTDYSEPATVVITVTPVNDAPVAIADSYSVEENDTLTVAPADGVLDNDSDVDGDPLTAVLVSGVLNGNVTLNTDGSFDYTPTNVAPYTDSFTYKADDGSLQSNEVIVTITVTEVNDPPIADAGGPYTGDEGSNITLSASGSSDPGGTIVSYDWDLDNDGQFDDAMGLTATFISTADGAFTVGLRVTDNLGATGTDTATVTVSNVAPTADAGGPYTGTEGSLITLSAADSSDPGSDIASYAWDFDLDGQYDDAIGVNPDFSSPTAGDYTVGVLVTDSNGATGTDTATITVAPASSATMNVANLDGSSTSVNRVKWQATVTIKVEDSSGGLVSGATVLGTWSNGVESTASTDSSGIATVNSTNVSKSSSISFTVTNISHATLAYEPVDNRDEGGDPSDGTTITVSYGDALLAASSLDSTVPVIDLTQDLANATAAQALNPCHYPQF